MTPVIHTVTDFGPGSLYSGQLAAMLARAAPQIPAIHLMADAPRCDPRRAAYLLAALSRGFQPGDVCLGVVDPGVGGPRPPVIAAGDGRWYVGPGNGLFALCLRHARQRQLWRITWRPETLSASFHGRDLFAPIAARLAAGERPGRDIAAEALDPGDCEGADWPDDLAEVIHVDAYGNAITGLRAASLAPGAVLDVAGWRGLRRATRFCDRPPGAALWYENSIGLVEIAVNRGRAEAAVGSPVVIRN